MLEPAVEGLPVERLGDPRGGDGLAGNVVGGQELEAHRAQAGPGHRRAGGVAGEDAVALRLHQPQALRRPGT